MLGGNALCAGSPTVTAHALCAEGHEGRKSRHLLETVPNACPSPLPAPGSPAPSPSAGLTQGRASGGRAVSCWEQPPVSVAQGLWPGQSHLVWRVGTSTFCSFQKKQKQCM